MQSNTRRVAIVGGNRIPFARSNSVYATASNQDMLTTALDGLAGFSPRIAVFGTKKYAAYFFRMAGQAVPVTADLRPLDPLTFADKLSAGLFDGLAHPLAVQRMDQREITYGSKRKYPPPPAGQLVLNRRTVATGSSSTPGELSCAKRGASGTP